MTIQAVAPFLPGPQSGTAGNLSIVAGDDFAARLQLGQVIKGRVLRHYEGTRYGVDFNGREKVVDSGVPLQSGEILYGKVVGLGDKVELERVRGSGAAPARAAQAATQRPAAPGGELGKLAAALFEQYQARLTPDQAQVLEQGVRAAGDKNAMALSGLLLSKLGVGLAPELMKAVYDLLRAEPGRGMFAPGDEAIELETIGRKPETAGEAAGAAPIPALAEALKQYVEASPERDNWERQRGAEGAPGAGVARQAGSAPDAHGQGAGFDLGRWLLNVQTGASVGHRVNTIALLVNGRLVELDIAVFEQRQGQQQREGIRHRQLSFSLRSEQLGHVGAHLVLAGEHMKVTLDAEREASAEALSAYSPELLQQLKSAGWLVDALHYDVRPAEGAGVARAVLQHVVTQGSLSRLV